MKKILLSAMILSSVVSASPLSEAASKTAGIALASAGEIFLSVQSVARGAENILLSIPKKALLPNDSILLVTFIGVPTLIAKVPMSFVAFTAGISANSLFDLATRIGGLTWRKDRW